jgi:hypothetical protein
MHKKQKAMLAHSISAFPGGGRCRKAADEAPNKIQFFAKRKSSKIYPIKHFALYLDCKYTKNEGYLPNLIKKKYLVQAIGEDFLAALEKQYLIGRLIRHASRATFPYRGRLSSPTANSRF